MAVDFNILARVPTIGSQIMAGQEAGREAAARNMLLQQRQLEFQQAQEDRSRKLEAERLQTEARPRLAQMLRQMGQNPGDLKAATEFTAAAFESNNPAAVTAGQEWIKLARELAAPEKPVVVGGRLVRPSTGEVVYQGPETAPRPIAIGNRLVSPTGEVVYEAPETPARPIAVGGRLVSPEGQVIYEAPETPARPIAIGNRLVSPAGEVVYEAPPPPSPAPRPIAVGGRLVSPEGQVIYEPPPAPAAAERPVVVGGRLVSPTGQVIYEPPPGTMTPAERFVPVGPNVFNRETGQFLPGPAREPALRQTPEARVKPAAPIRVRPGEVVISPETGQPIFTAPPAPARAPAGRAAAAPGAPAAGTPAQQAKAEAQQAAQTKLSQDLQTQLGYYEELAKMGAMSSPGRPVVANVLAYARSSGLGQEAERAAGTKAQTLRDNIANARQRILMHVKNATGATAGQMNTNVELQTWLRSLTDPQQSIETVRETLKQMDAVIGSVRNQVAQEGTRRAPVAAPAAAPSRSTGVDIQTERTNAQAAIAAGAPEAAVRQRFKDKTGQEL